MKKALGTLNPKNGKYPETSVGVVVGRFQVSELHNGHQLLLNTIYSKHPKSIVVIGESHLLSCYNDPLDFETRKQMILDYYEDMIVLSIKGCVSNEVWSKNLDNLIKSSISENDSVVLYGSRDSFLSCYSGEFQTCELEECEDVCGKDHRKEIRNSTGMSQDFRAGAIWATGNRFPHVVTAVDVAVLRGPDELCKEKSVLLCRKPHKTTWQFVGGFTEPDSLCFEADASRELHEECGMNLEVGGWMDFKYVGSSFINDWRYRHELDKIKSIFFAVQYQSGFATAMDDIEKVRWFSLSEISENRQIIHDDHQTLVDLLLNYLNR